MGHLLDVIITRTDVVLRSVQLDPPMLSDHCQIVAEFDIPVRRSTDVVRRVRRCWRSFDCDEFVRDIEQSSLVQSPPADVDELFTLYDVTLRSLLNKLRHGSLLAPRKSFDILALYKSDYYYYYY